MAKYCFRTWWSIRN